jgi:hypothetical protein
MIPRDTVTAWSALHPWPTVRQVEQDLLLSQAVVAVEAEHSVTTPRWSGTARVPTVRTPALIAGKVRALYQRSKGRDVFDIWLALTQLQIDPDTIVAAGRTVWPESMTAERTIANLRAKLADRLFRTDVDALVSPLDQPYDIDAAAELVVQQVLSRIQ